jgi:hypothetical protein
VQVEQEVWNFVDAANADLPPHSRIRRQQVVLIPASSATLLPVNSKGDVIVRQVETLFAEQIDKMYRHFSRLLSAPSSPLVPFSSTFPHYLVSVNNCDRYKTSSFLASQYPEGNE